MWQNLIAALKNGSWAPALTSLITIAVTVGLLTASQASAVTDVLGAVGSLVSVVIAAIHAFKGVQLVKSAAPKTAP